MSQENQSTKKQSLKSKPLTLSLLSSTIRKSYHNSEHPSKRWGHSAIIYNNSRLLNKIENSRELKESADDYIANDNYSKYFDAVDSAADYTGTSKTVFLNTPNVFLLISIILFIITIISFIFFIKRQQKRNKKTSK